MDLLINNVIVAEKDSPFYNKKVNILIENGVVSEIGVDVSKENVDIFDAHEACISSGWVEIFSDFSDPGYEYKETLQTGCAAALAGGYTKIFTIPNTLPPVQNKASVEYITRSSAQLPVDILPLGAISKNIEGNALAEMYDMHASGAVAFSDGNKNIQSAGLLVKALQYIKSINGVIITQPVEETFGSNGQMNEGIISTQLGLQGMPAVAEHIMIMRDIELLRYTNSRMHITEISTAKSVDLIKQAKAEGLHITCSVTPHHLYFCDEDITNDYDTNLKVNVPLRTREDRDALKKAVLDGIIDSIAVHHFPQHADDKDCEFEYAKHGMIGLQTAFSVVRTTLPKLSHSQIVNLFSLNNREIFHLQKSGLQKGEKADITIFSMNEKFTFTKELNKSKSSNSPFWDIELKGKIIGVFSKNNFYIH